jgi:hypothetical protein
MHVQVLSVHLGGQLQTEDQQNKCCILLKNTNYAGQTTEKREVNWLLFFLSSSLPLLGIFNKLKLKNQTIIIFEIINYISERLFTTWIINMLRFSKNLFFIGIYFFILFDKNHENSKCVIEQFV